MLVRRVVQPGKRLACNTCGGVELETAEAHREHHRTDWHRLNCKRKVKALEPLALEAFEALPAAQRAALLAADC
jgi:pre-60S factor REI1